MTHFTDLGLSDQLLKALADEGYTTPTPIQARAIPAVIAGSDLLGIAQTGTGKTAAFALPILHRLAANLRRAPAKGCRVLVLSPTRELASQIADSFRAYGRHMQVSVATVFGGVSHRPQIQMLARGVDVLVATPGRLLDHINERALLLQTTEVLVLDEADQMLDLGFVKPIRRIVSQTTARRQTLFFSATMPHEIAAMVSDFLRDPVKVQVTPVSSTVERVGQRVIHVEQRRKAALLGEIFANPELSRTLVFTRTKRGADRVAKHLETIGVGAAAIHGNKSQRQREEALDLFRRAKIRVLVATDIAARGIDIDGVSHVINYELPEVPEAYVHRIGRTGRAGASGSAISLCDPEERDRLRMIERLTRQTIPSEDRRGDTQLAETRGAGRPDGRRNDHGRGDHPRGGRHHGEGRGEHRRDSHEQRHTTGAARRPQFEWRGDRQERNADGAHTAHRRPEQGGHNAPFRADGAEASSRPPRGDGSNRPHRGDGHQRGHAHDHGHRDGRPQDEAHRSRSQEWRRKRRPHSAAGGRQTG